MKIIKKIFCKQKYKVFLKISKNNKKFWSSIIWKKHFFYVSFYYSIFIEELENFNTNNTQRIINALKIITERNESLLEQANSRLFKLDPNSEEIK